MKEFDLIVIGGGAGLNVASGAAERGLKTAIIEKGPLGGTCLNRGCIPSKMIIHSAEVAETIKNSAVFGLKSKLQGLDFKKVTDRANDTVDAESKGIENSLRSGNNPTLFKDKAQFIDKKIILVNGKRITADKIVLAIGARPFIPSITGLDKVPFLTSTEALRQTKLPESMIIIGGGYIGVELGYFYSAMGCRITIIQRGPLLIPREDRDLANLFTNLWKKKYQIMTDCSILKVEKRRGEIIVYTKTGRQSKKLVAEKLLIATGIKPNTDLIDIEKSGVKTTEQGFIKVNKFMETNVKGIWALGDVAGIYFFRHSANLEADYVLNNILSKKKAVDYYPLPHAIFTEPQVAGVGFTEQEARKSSKDFVVGKYYYKNAGMGQALSEKYGFVKLIVSPKTKEILGCHIIGPHASVLLHEVCVAMKCGKNALDLLRKTVHVHPALSEVVQRAALNVPL